MKKTDGIWSVRGENHVMMNNEVIRETDGICSVRGLNHVIDNGGD